MRKASVNVLEKASSSIISMLTTATTVMKMKEVLKGKVGWELMTLSLYFN